MNLKKLERYLRVNLLGPVPRLMKKKNYWAAVSQSLRNTDLLLQGYMFRLLRVIIRPSNEPIQDYLIPSALWDPVTLTIGGVIVL